MFDPSATSGSTPPTRADARRALLIGRWAVLATAICWTIAAGASAVAAQSAPNTGAPSGATAPRSGDMIAPPDAADDSTAHDVAREIQELAPLEEALRDVHGLTQPQSDSLAALEQRYAKVFASLAGTARTLIDDASSEGVAPNAGELRSLCETVWSVRGAELLSARAMLTTRAQRARFDANVTKIQYEEAQLVEDVLRRSLPGLGGTVRT